MSVRDEHGFTLMEMLVALSVGVIVLGAALGIVTISSKAARGAQERTDEQARGRVGTEAVQRPLRAITCVSTSVPAFVYASPTMLAFNADLSGAAGFTPDEHAVGTVTNGNVTSVQLGGYTAGQVATATTTAPAWPAPTMRSLLNDIVAPTGTTPLFTYYGRAADGVSLDALNATPSLSLTDLARVARIDVSFAVQASDTGQKVAAPVTFSSALYPRDDQVGPSTSIPVFGC